MKRKLLLVEDEISLGETLTERLQKEAYQTFWSLTRAAALECLKNCSIDLAILDVGLPDGSGFELAKYIAQKYPGVAFMFLTAQSTAEMRLKGFEIGAEEFIPKPFHLKELLLRVRHVLEKHHPELGPVVLGDRTLEVGSRSVRLPGGGREFFQSRDYDALCLLLKKSPEVVSRDEILDQVWGENNYPSSRTVDNTIVRLRQLLGDRSGRFIRSVRGVGYQWCYPDEVVR